jgi:glycine/D-amino acid oxidase-like deaminating enzyme
MGNRVCIIGGGATGAALLWALSQAPNSNWDITLMHDGPALGGHSLTQYVPWNGQTFPVDVGVQFISPMLYPNVRVMLERPEFGSRVPVTAYDALKIACAFPRNAQGAPANWGNFPDYQSGPNFALYDEDMRYDANVFQNFLQTVPFDFKTWGMKSLQDYFDNPPQTYRNLQQFINFFVAPYLSIINGYGAALMDQTLIVEMLPLFDIIPLEKTPLGSFTQPGTGWQRFTNGAQSWVQAMADVAQTYKPSKILLNTHANFVSTDQSSGEVTVVYKTEPTAVIQSATFDKVVLTTDMWTNSKLLNNPQNTYFWNNLYQQYVGYGRDVNNNPLGQPVVWDLMWGQCYIHSDSSMLSPDLTQQEETLQFTAYYAPTSGGNFDLAKTYTTYMQENLLAGPGAKGLYLTMYGYIPSPANGDKVPDPSKVIYTTPWTHGKWTPAFMGGAKGNLHLAQGLGKISYPGQMNTNVYFAGNNTTTDAEEGALDSALAIAEYAFGVDYPFTSFEAFAMYDIYRGVMFPSPSTGYAVASKLLTVNSMKQAANAALLANPKANVKARKAPAKKAKPTTNTSAKKARIRAKRPKARSKNIAAKKPKRK